MENRIIEIAQLVEFLARNDVTSKQKAEAVKLDIKNGVISNDEGLELIIYYT